MSRPKFRQLGEYAWRPLRRRLAARFRHDQSGAVAVEFGLVAIPFFTLIFAIMQIALVFLADQILESAVTDASRSIRTGQVTASNTTASNFNTQYLCPRLFGLFDCTKLYVDIESPSSFSAMNLTVPTYNQSSQQFQPAASYNTGSSGQIVVVSVFYLYPVLFSNFGLNLADQSNGTRLLGAVSAFRNEPF